MKITIIFMLFAFITTSWAQSSMRRCTLLPITDSVGGAIGFKVFEEIEADLKQNNWCTYVSNSGLIGVFSRYRDNLPRYLKEKSVLATVASKLKVGSIIRVGIINEIQGVEIQMDVYGENGEDLYFSERINRESDDVETISQTVKTWLEMYSKMIPYDALVNGILGDQITLDVGKGYPIQIGQEFVIKRSISKKKHPLLKKIVDWETEVLGSGEIFNISDNQALGLVKNYKTDKKILLGDWVRLGEYKKGDDLLSSNQDKKDNNPGTLGILSLALFAARSGVDTSTPTGNNTMSGMTFGLDVKAEGWITREYFAGLEIARSMGTLSKESGNPTKSSVNTNVGVFKLFGGYKYLPIGFFHGPQVDVYAGFANYSFDLDHSQTDGFGKTTFSGILAGVGANVPINREYRFFAKGEFLPFPSFKDTDGIYGAAKSATVMDLEAGIKYQYRPRMTLDGSLETILAKAKFDGNYKEVSFKDNWRLKLGASFNF